MVPLQVRMTLLVTVFFGIIYAVVVVLGTAMGLDNFYFFLFISLFFMFIQYMLGPKMIEWTMRVRYIQSKDAPQLFDMVEDLARKAQIPMPKIAIADVAIPNAFAFGRSMGDGRVCVSQGILNLLSSEELQAVLGHELTHIKNRDVVTITLLSVLPMLLYRLAWHFMFYGNDGYNRREERGNNTFLIGAIAFIFYFITNLLVLYASRIREYYADKGSVDIGNNPSALASALYKLVYGSAKLDRNSLREVEGCKAFFANDPSRAKLEIRELSQLDLDRSGTIDASEMALLKSREINLTFSDYLMEAFSTHPNMLKRIKHLSQLRAG